MYSLHSALQMLESEAAILHRLYYRNHNQHGKSKLFGYLKQVKKTIPFLNMDQVLQLNKNGEAVMRLKTSVTNNSDVNNRLECLVNQHKAMSACLECANFCTKAMIVLTDQLKGQLFVPLFTTLLSLTARIFHCLTSITAIIRAQHSSLLIQLKNVCLMCPKYAPIIASSTIAASLTSQQAALLDTLMGQNTSADTAADAAAQNALNLTEESTGSSLEALSEYSRGHELSTTIATTVTSTPSTSAATAAQSFSDDEGEEVGAPIYPSTSLYPAPLSAHKSGGKGGMCGGNKGSRFGAVGGGKSKGKKREAADFDDIDDIFGSADKVARR